MEDDTKIACRCQQCGTVYPVKFKYRYNGVCYSCSQEENAMVKLTPLSFAPHEAVAVAPEEWLTWSAYEEEKENKNM